MAFSFTGFLKGLLLQNEVDRTKQLAIQASASATTGTETILDNANQTANQTIHLPNVSGSDTLVGAATAQTLTNKTFDSTSNLTGAEITSFTPDGTHTITVPAVTDTLVTLAATQTLTNKSMSGTNNTFTNLPGAAITGTVAIANGGTGQTTQQAALNALAGSVTSGNFLRGNGTNILVAPIQVSDVPTLNQNTTGTAANVTATSNSTLTTLSALSLPGSQVTGNITGNAANITATSNSTLTSLPSLALPGSQITMPIPLLQTNVVSDSTTTGSAATLQSSDITAGNIRLTNASLVSVSGIPAGASGQQIIVENQTGNTITINNNDAGATTANRIYTGTGAALTIAANSTLFLVYDTTAARWMVVGGSGSSSGSGSKNYLSIYTASTASGVPNVGNGNFELGSTTGWGLAHTTLSGGVIPLTSGTSGVGYVGGLRIWTVSSANATVGAVYTNNGNNYTVQGTIAAGTLLVTTDGGTTSGITLTKSSGTGDATITYSSSVTTTANTGTTTLSTVTSGSQIGGSYSGSLACTTTSTSGDMLISSPFFIDQEDQAKVLTVKYYYKVISGLGNMNFSGTSASNTFTVWLYDVTNGAWIQPAGSAGMTQGSGVGYVTGTFQTTTNSSQYQLAIVNTVGTSGAYTVYFDDFSVGPQTAPLGAPMSDWVAYTPTFTGFGTPTNVNFYSRRVADSLEVWGFFTSGTTTATANQITLGYNGANGNVSINPNKILSSTIIGNAVVNTTSTTTFGWTVMVPNSSSNYISLGIQTSTTSGAVTTTNASTVIGSAVNATLHFTVPIQGWSSNVSMSNDTDTRVVAMRVNSATPTASSFSGTAPVVFGTAAQFDTHTGYSTSSGQYTVPVSGFYRVGGALRVSGTATANQTVLLSVSKNGLAQQEGAIRAAVAGLSDYNVEVTCTVQCVAGDLLDLRVNTPFTSPGFSSDANGNFFQVERLSGPSVVAATESVNARYVGVGSQSIPISSATALTLFTSKTYDTHNAFNTGTGLYTVPVSGKYQVTLTITTNSSVAAASVNDALYSYIYHNGSPYSLNGVSSSTTTAVFYTASNTDTISCNAGDTIGAYCLQNLASPITVGVANTGMWFTVTRIGN